MLNRQQADDFFDYIADWMRTERKAQKLTLKQLSKRIYGEERHFPYMSRLENKVKRPELEMVYRIAKALGYEVELTFKRKETEILDRMEEIETRTRTKTVRTKGKECPKCNVKDSYYDGFFYNCNNCGNLFM